VQRVVRFNPFGEFSFNRKNDVIQLRRVSVMEVSPAGGFPDPLDRIQLRAIGGEEVEDEMFAVFLPPLGMKMGRVESGVVGNHHHASTGAGAGRPKMFEELPAGEGVEFIRLASRPRRNIQHCGASDDGAAQGPWFPAGSISGNANRIDESALRP
jgi:hypothetical protein